MAKTTVTLTKGINVAGRENTEAVLREPTAGDWIEAVEESERVVMTPDGYKLVSSPFKADLNLLRRQIVRIGEVAGPLTLGQLGKLSPEDLWKLKEAAASFDQITAESESRGRSAASPQRSGDGHGGAGETDGTPSV